MQIESQPPDALTLACQMLVLHGSGCIAPGWTDAEIETRERALVVYERQLREGR